MPGAMTDYLENKLIDHILRSTAFTQPAGIYLALGNSAADGSFAELALTGGYARTSIGRGNTVWTATQGGTSGDSSGTSGATGNAAAITLPTPTATWNSGSDIGYFALYDAVSGGNPLFYGALAVPKRVYQGAGAPTIGPGVVAVTLGSSLANYLKNKLIDHIFRNTAFSQPAGIHAAFGTAATDAAFTEISAAGSYGRASVGRSDSAWTATQGGTSGTSSGTGGQTSNAAAVNFAAPTATWNSGNDIGFIGLYDAASGGNYLGWCAVTPVAQRVYSGDAAPTIPAGYLTVTLD